MRVFVTGVSGFLGRNLIRALRARRDEVRALTRSDTAGETVQELGAEPVRGDLEDTDALRAGMDGCEVVYHVAALARLWGLPEDFHRLTCSVRPT